jgi:hypothetical protein
MGRLEEIAGAEIISLNLTSEQKQELKTIACRDTGGNMSKLSRKIIEDFIKSHKAGNTSYTLDDFGKHKDMIAIPALMSNRDEIKKYVMEEYDRAELEKVLRQCEFLEDLIKTKLLTQTNNDPETYRIEQRRKSRLRLLNDIRFKNYETLNETEKLMWRHARSQYTDEGWELLQERKNKELEELDSKNEEIKQPT